MCWVQWLQCLGWAKRNNCCGLCCVALLAAEFQNVTELLTLNVVSRWRMLAASADSAASR